MNKEKFKSKSIELCQSVLSFSKSLEEAENLISEITAPENKDDNEIRNSKLRKLKETFSKIVRHCEDAFAESKELDRIPEDGDDSIKRKTKIQVKNFNELNKKVKSMNDSIQGVDALTSVSANSKINFSEVLTNKLANFSVEFGELKEITSDSIDSVEETAEKVNQMIEEDKAKDKKNPPEIGNDSIPKSEQPKSITKDEKETMNFEEMRKDLDETIAQVEEKVNNIKDEKIKSEFAEKIKEIKEMKMDDADQIEQKMTRLEKFSEDFFKAKDNAEPAACEKCGKSPCICDEIKIKDEAINSAIDQLKERPEAANFSKVLTSLQSIKCFSEKELEEKLESAEEIKNKIKESSENVQRGEKMTEEVKKNDELLNQAIDELKERPEAANFSKILTSLKSIVCFSEDELEEKLEATEEVKENLDKATFGDKPATEAKPEAKEEPKADVQKLAECVDKMEDILSTMNPSEELKQQFCGLDKAIQNFCKAPSKGSANEATETIEKFRDAAAKETATYSAKRSFSKLTKCFAELSDTISASNLPESSVDKLTPPQEAGGTDVKKSVDSDEIKKQNDEINGILVEAEKAVSRIKDPAIKNFASKRIKLISKMACFSEKDIDAKLTETEELSNDIKETIKNQEPETTKKETEATPEKPIVKPDDPSKSISDKEAANFSATSGNVPAWKSIYSK